MSITVLGERRPAHLREMFVPISFACPGTRYRYHVWCGVPLGKVPTTFGSAEDPGCTPMFDRVGAVARSSDGCV